MHFESIPYNVGKTIINHPPVITIFIGAINHAQMGGLFFIVLSTVISSWSMSSLPSCNRKFQHLRHLHGKVFHFLPATGKPMWTRQSLKNGTFLHLCSPHWIKEYHGASWLPLVPKLYVNNPCSIVCILYLHVPKESDLKVDAYTLFESNVVCWWENHHV